MEMKLTYAFKHLRGSCINVFTRMLDEVFHLTLALKYLRSC